MYHMSQSSETRSIDAVGTTILVIGALVSVAVWILLGTNLASVTEVLHVQQIAIGLSIGSAAVLTTGFARYLDLSYPDTLFVSFTGLYLIVLTFLWLLGSVRVATSASIFGMFLLLSSYMVFVHQALTPSE
mgnify:CR=1 FL=1